MAVDVPFVSQLTPGNTRSGTGNTNMWTHYDADPTKSAQYAVVTHRDWWATVHKRLIGESTWTSYDLRNVTPNPTDGYGDYPPGYPGVGNGQGALGMPVHPDAHNTLSLCVDAQGYIHITGNTHSHNRRYIISTQPHLITSWRAYRRPSGAWPDVAADIDDRGNPPAVQGGVDDHTYTLFEKFANGELLWFYDQTDSASSVGRDQILFKKGIAAGSKWLPFKGAGQSGELIICGGEAPGPARIYIHRGCVVNDIVHIWGSCRDMNRTGYAQKDPYYIRSTNRGLTWQSVTGNNITLPASRTTLYAAGAIIPIPPRAPNAFTTIAAASNGQMLPGSPGGSTTINVVTTDLTAKAGADYFDETFDTEEQYPNTGFFYIDGVRGSDGSPRPWPTMMTYTGRTGTTFTGCGPSGPEDPSPVGELRTGMVVRPVRDTRTGNGITVDQFGHPHIQMRHLTSSAYGAGRGEWLHSWTGSAWTQQLLSQVALSFSLPEMAFFDNRAWIVATHSGRIRCTELVVTANTAPAPGTTGGPLRPGRVIFLGGGVPNNFYPSCDLEMLKRGIVSVMVPDGDVPRHYTYGEAWGRT